MKRSRFTEEQIIGILKEQVARSGKPHRIASLYQQFVPARRPFGWACAENIDIAKENAKLAERVGFEPTKGD